MKPSSSFNRIIYEFENEWKFREDVLMEMAGVSLFTDTYLSGKLFYAYSIPGLRYHVQIYPNGKKWKDPGFAQIRFGCYGCGCGCTKKPELEIEVSIESANFSQSLSSFNGNGGNDGANFCKFFVPHKELFDPKNNFFVNGEMTIKVKGILTALRPSTPIISSYICIEWKIKEQDFSEPVSTDKILGSKEITVSPLSGVKCQLMSCKTMCSSSDPCETELSGAKCYTPACIEILFESRVKPGNETKIYAALDYSIDSADYNEQLGFVCDKDFCLGLNSADYRERKLLKRTFFVNGVLTLNLKGIFMVKKPHNDQFKTLTLAKSFASKSALKRKNKDFLIVIGDKEIQVHKKVLLAASKSMIGNKESFDNKMVIIDFPFKIVDIAVKLIYGKCILLKSSLEDMLLLFRFGDKYRIQTIMDMVEECLIGEISPVTVVYLIKFSSPDSTNVPFLYQKCVEFFIKCLKEATPIYAAESLGEEFLESMFSKSILSNFTDSIN